MSFYVYHFINIISSNEQEAIQSTPILKMLSDPKTLDLKKKKNPNTMAFSSHVSNSNLF